jgi:transposase
MHNQYTDLFVNLPEVNVQQIVEIDKQTIHIQIVPKSCKQACPICRSDRSVIRKGSNQTRKIRHTDAFGKIVYILAPAIRLFCKNCQAGFVWKYSFVRPGRRYSTAFEQQAIRTASVSTVKQSAEIYHIPASTLQTKHQQWLSVESERLRQLAWNDALSSSHLVLGIDDFAIRKGHTYNTGIHDLRGETLLDILPGRKLDELREYARKHPEFLALRPKAVVMDLAPYYHAWIQECFPGALRVADRFHVMRYVIDALQAVRKDVQGSLSARARANLKAKHRLLNPQAASLPSEKQRELQEILSYASLLQQVYAWKEALGEWYDGAPDAKVAAIWFDRWLEQGELLQHPAVAACIKTMRHWRTEIVHYHSCRWTNAAVEGRNNRMKAYQRRHYFTRNRERYVQGLLVECNRERFGT